MIPPPQIYHHAWPDRVVRVGRKLKNAVWGHGVQVYITVEVRVYLCSPLFLRQIIAPSATSATAPSMDELDYDTLSYSSLPVRGELLGVLDLTAKPNSTTVEFACPSKADNLVVELKCQRVACHVSFKQIEMVPRFGFELVRRRE
ncbi:hypothetical protein HBH99_257030 [Parastagonospora nodorum]|nr:hypothetical protein HBH99_257030 [Parastagonospora nodorum]